MSACDHSSPNKDRTGNLKRDAAPRLVALGDGHERDFASGVFDRAPYQRDNQRHSERNCDDRESQQIEHGQLPHLAGKRRHPIGQLCLTRDFRPCDHGHRCRIFYRFMHRSHDQWASEEWGAHVRFTANVLSALSLRPRQVTPVVVRCALAGAGARKAMSEMRPGDSDRAAHGSANDIRSGPIRESAILALGRLRGVLGPEEFLARPAFWFGWQRRVTSNSEVGRDS